MLKDFGHNIWTADGSEVVAMMGFQKSDCRSEGVSGSVGKSEPPALHEGFQSLRLRLARCGQVLKLATIVVVAAEIFPGEASSRYALGKSVRRRRTPVDAQHGVTSLYRAA